MKKLLIIFTVILQLLCPSYSLWAGSFVYFKFENPNQPDNDTMEKDDAFIEEIKAIAKEYNYKIEKDNFYNQINERAYVITINDEQNISISLTNNGYKSKTGYSMFSVHYTRYDDSDFDVELFTKIVNVMSSKQISAEECKEFLNADYDKYPPERWGYAGASESQIKKVKGYSFWQDWEMTYEDYGDNCTIFSFGGLTK